MTRTDKFTDEEFMKAYRASDSMLALMKRLKCSRPTIYRYLRKQDLEPLRGPTQEPKAPLFNDRRHRLRIPKHNPIAVAKHYTYRATLSDVAGEVGLFTNQAITRYLKMLVTQPKRFYLTKKFLPPKRVCHIKIINYLIKRGRLNINPNDLVELLGLKPTWIQQYWEPAFGLKLSDYEPATIISKKEK